MKLKLKAPFKSINKVPLDLDLPDFVVLTGVNGSGKSHLLEAIKDGQIVLVGNDEISHANTRYFDFTTLVPSDSESYEARDSEVEINLAWEKLAEARVNWINTQIGIFKECPNIMAMEPKDILSCSDVDLVRLSNHALAPVLKLRQSFRQGLNGFDVNVLNAFSKRVASIHYPRIADGRDETVIAKLRQSFGFPLILMEREDFEKYYQMACDPTPIFLNLFSKIFVDYQARVIQNSLSQMANEKGDTSESYLSPDDFQRIYGPPPWDMVNELLASMGLNYIVNRPEKFKFVSFKAQLKNITSDANVNFSHLSSGEKVLISLLICRYQLSDENENLDLPRVLLLDEIDAPLHPSMTKKMIEVIQEQLVEKMGLKVILTTHSPSTVALAPEGSLFVMRRLESDRIEKVTKDKALSVLLDGIPTLSVNYENRRQVFLESKNDVRYFDVFYDVLKEHLNREVSLTFIAVGTEKGGGCNTLTHVVQSLANAGNKSIFGIIDWDKKNSVGERVKVIGEGKRYSIENFIFDPLLIAGYLIREKKINETDVGVGNFLRYGALSKAPDSVLQVYVDFVLKKMMNAANDIVDDLDIKIQNLEKLDGKNKDQLDKLNDLSEELKQRKLIHEKMNSNDIDLIECKYVGGIQLRLPSWFLHTQGHFLHKYLAKSFPIFSQRSEEDIRKLIINNVVSDFHEFLPQCILDVLREVQKPIA